ncbi:ATP-dependent helicase HepA [Rubripirellula tenax]|uniref:ATP-dependent helicase HepA n=1 Tax=Rubripirellula tenax TaxID=2528015 RepID=A0A5C6F4Y4_9BACT|nr:helicase-related protein [Rubripirellula tenax]TWU54899.1 ATP-dependent helicase HepA [Rubripirellula tenax]
MSTLYPFHQSINLHVEGRISTQDADRQRVWAEETLKRLANQPGMILADEVGTGKTFVALAVAVSTALANQGNRPVVVMVPSSLKEKWPGDFSLFCQACLPSEVAGGLRSKLVEKGVDFLKLLDDSPSERCSLIFMTHGAMSRGLDDPWVTLALIQRSLHRRRNIDDLKRAMGRNLGDLLRMKWLTNRDETIWSKLLQSPPTRWRRLLEGLVELTDDPVPEAITDVLPDLDLSFAFEAVQQIPIRRTKHYPEKVVKARQEIKSRLSEVWKECLAKFHDSLPLLILDEAHHLKNSGTRLASLFRSEDSQADAVAMQGALAGVFERMLFLTATPFQLGHGELCNVMDRFDGVNWTGPSAPSMGRDGYAVAKQTLRTSLDRAQETAVGLDHVWGKLREDDLVIGDDRYASVEQWWMAVQATDDLAPLTSDVKARFGQAKTRLKETESLLRPWVLRHMKLRSLPDYPDVPRRERRSGNAISLDSTTNDDTGIAVSGEALLPFLLASRASTCNPESRPVFAEGLASSYEAFLHTRNKEGERSVDEDDDDGVVIATTDDAATWYLDHLEKLIPRNRAAQTEHPKVDATVARVLDIWKRGEKAVVFCHYVQTGRALRRSISAALDAEIRRMGCEKLNCETTDVSAELNRIGNTFFDADRPLRQACDTEVMRLLSEFPSLKDDAESLLGIVRRNLRTPSFLVRFFPLGSELDAVQQIQHSFDAVDLSGISLRQIVIDFFSFLTNRCSDEQRRKYVDAVNRIQTGSHFGADVADANDVNEYEDDELQGDKAEQLLPNVRLVNGQTRSETRQRLMLTFNTPFYPEVLVASSVLSEGVDLHLNCRYMIHHDLCWNPSNLEQRTGRIDRIGAKAERAGQSIQVFLPFIAETQDEKMYRVVMDRERWFNVVMGEDYRIDAKTTDKLASRIPFPESAARELSFRLEA